jgi:hypothetical protein
VEDADEADGQIPQVAMFWGLLVVRGW